MQRFRFYTKDDLLSLTKIRRFETKLGERLQVLPNNQEPEAALLASAAKFVLFGI